MKSLLLLILLCSGLLASAQDDKIIYDFNYGKTSKKTSEAYFLQNQIKFNFPIKTGNRSGFVLGPEFGILKVSRTGLLADSNSLKTIGLKVAYHTIVGQKTLFSISAEPLIASDFIDISGEDIRFRSEAIFMFHLDKKFAYGFGMGYQYQFSGSQLLPLVVMVWKISDNVTLSGPLPLIPSLDFKLNNQWSIGGGLMGEYSSYRLSATQFRSQYVQDQNFNFGFKATYKPSRQLTLGGFLGLGSRRLDVYDKTETIPLRIFGWNIGGGSHIPNKEQKFTGLALNLNLGYKF